MRSPFLAVLIARFKRLATYTDFGRKPFLQHWNRCIWYLALIVKFFKFLESMIKYR